MRLLRRLTLRRVVQLHYQQTLIGVPAHRLQVVDRIAALGIGPAGQARVPGGIDARLRVGPQLLPDGGLLLQRRAHGPVDAVLVQHRLGVGVQRPGGGGTPHRPGGGHGGGDIHVPGQGAAALIDRVRPDSQQQRRRQRHRHANRHQRHPRGVLFEPGDGLDAPPDVLSAVGHGGGPRRPGVLLIGHGEQDAPVVPALLALQ